MGKNKSQAELEMKANKIEDLLEKGEKVIFNTKPSKKAYVWMEVLNSIPPILGFILFGVLICLFLGREENSMVLGILGFLLALTVIVLLSYVIKIIVGYAEYKNVEYVFTGKRIIIRKGLIGIDVESVYYADVTRARLEVDLLARMFKVGTIAIETSSNSAYLQEIENPYRVLSEIQKITNDIKTDMMYPNALRPEENEGYNTKYVRKPKKSTTAKKSASKSTTKSAGTTKKTTTKKSSSNKKNAEK